MQAAIANKPMMILVLACNVIFQLKPTPALARAFKAAQTAPKPLRTLRSKQKGRWDASGLFGLEHRTEKWIRSSDYSDAQSKR
jgi:hypothetical protein